MDYLFLINEEIFDFKYKNLLKKHRYKLDRKEKEEINEAIKKISCINSKIIKSAYYLKYLYYFGDVSIFNENIYAIYNDNISLINFSYINGEILVTDKMIENSKYYRLSQINNVKIDTVLFKLKEFMLTDKMIYNISDFVRMLHNIELLNIIGVVNSKKIILTLTDNLDSFDYDIYNSNGTNVIFSNSNLFNSKLNNIKYFLEDESNSDVTFQINDILSKDLYLLERISLNDYDKYIFKRVKQKYLKTNVFRYNNVDSFYIWTHVICLFLYNYDNIIKFLPYSYINELYNRHVATKFINFLDYIITNEKIEASKFIKNLRNSLAHSCYKIINENWIKVYSKDKKIFNTYVNIKFINLLLIETSDVKRLVENKMFLINSSNNFDYYSNNNKSMKNFNDVKKYLDKKYIIKIRKMDVYLFSSTDLNDYYLRKDKLNRLLNLINRVYLSNFNLFMNEINLFFLDSLKLDIVYEKISNFDLDNIKKHLFKYPEFYNYTFVNQNNCLNYFFCLQKDRYINLDIKFWLEYIDNRNFDVVPRIVYFSDYVNFLLIHILHYFYFLLLHDLSLDDYSSTILSNDKYLSNVYNLLYKKDILLKKEELKLHEKKYKNGLKSIKKYIFIKKNIEKRHIIKLLKNDILICKVKSNNKKELKNIKDLNQNLEKLLKNTDKNKAYLNTILRIIRNSFAHGTVKFVYNNECKYYTDILVIFDDSFKSNKKIKIELTIRELFYLFNHLELLKNK